MKETRIHSLSETRQDSRNGFNNDRYLVIYNKYSGRVKIRDRGKMVKNLFDKNNIYYYFIHLKLNQDLSDLQLSKIIKKEKIDKILVVGGDGTVRRVVEDFYNNNVINPIAFFPTGSTSLYASVLGISYQSPATLKKLFKAKVKSMPIGILNNNYIFLMSACYGNLAKITIKAHNYFKNLFGFFSYIAAGIRHGAYIQTKKVTLLVDNENKTICINSVMIFLTDTINNRMPLPFDTKKKFQILLIKNKNLLSLIDALSCIYFKRRSSKYVEIISANQIEINPDFTEDFHIDGDLIYEKEKHSLRILDKKINFLV